MYIFFALTPILLALDVGINHNTSNKYFFSSLSTSDYLPSMTMTNGSKVSSYDIGNIHLLPSLFIDNVLYVPGFPFNLLSISHFTRFLNCVISFYQRFYLFIGSKFRTDD